ncbi:hypothetical protein MY1884_004615 [Beauveria asiatica]
MVDFTDNIHEDENSSVGLAWTGKRKPAAFDGFYSADGMLRDDTRVTSMAQLVGELGITQVAGNQRFPQRRPAYAVRRRKVVGAHQRASRGGPVIDVWFEHVDLYSASLKLRWERRWLNYACAVQDAIASYGTQSAAKIRAAADKYDAYGVFQSLRVSGFKIPKHHSKTEL